MPPEEMLPGISGTNNPAPANAGHRHSSPAAEPDSDRGTLGGPVSAAVIKGGAAGGAAGGAEEPPPAATRRRPQADPGADPSVSVPPIPAELTGPQPHPAAVPDHGAGSAVAADGQSSAHGLVICAKTVHAQVGDGPAATDGSVEEAFGPSFPGQADVASAASRFRSPEAVAGVDRRDIEFEGGQFHLTIGPGMNQLSWTRPVLVEKSLERTASRGRRVTVNDLERELRDALDGFDESASRAPGMRGAITSWSRKSRANMCRKLAEYDYHQMFADGRTPAMVTFTYPDDWLTVAPSGTAVKRHLRLWAKRFRTEWNETPRYIWKMEFQMRGAPHLHLGMAFPARTGKSGLPFRQWCSRTWADIVDHPDPEQRARHLNAGTAVDIIAGVKGRDPKRLAIYFTKHAAPNSSSSKEYQHIVPDAWLQPGKGPGRFWGVAGLKRATVKVEIGRTDYINARRIVRRWSRSQAAYADPNSRFPTAVNPRTAKVCVRRADSKTGRATLRWVSRRRQLCTQGGLAGGFALANNGPEFASQLARALSQW